MKLSTIVPVLFLIVALSLLSSGFLAAQDDHDHDHEQADSLSNVISRAEINEVAKDLIAPCCWSETADLHRSGAAIEVRNIIAKSLAKGETKEQIMQEMVARYGERILATPKAEGFNYMAWILPAFGLLFGGFLAWKYLASNTESPDSDSGQHARHKKSTASTGEYEQRIEKDLQSWD